VPEASSTISQLASGLRDGEANDGEFRLAQSIRPGAAPGARWYRVRARAFTVPSQRQPLNAWQLADISPERAEQERFFLDLQQAIDHLDHAPAGFFSADQDGRITYVNATLAEWLGIDLASFTPGAVTLDEVVAGDGMALVRSVKADPGTTRNAVIDLDLATSRARPCRCDSCTASRQAAKASTGRRARLCLIAPRARTLPHNCVLRRCASRASSIRRRWRSPALITMAAFCAPMHRSCRCFRLSSIGMPSTARSVSTPSSTIATERLSRPLSRRLISGRPILRPSTP
jgi:hypothetical protein